MSENETIHESDTGAKKARNDVRMSLVPTEELLELAQHYGRGSEKYGAENWRKGMPFSWHYDALQRHLLKWWGGEDSDAETGSSHLAAVQFHVFGLMYGLKHHPDQDDRYTVSPPPLPPIKVDALGDEHRGWRWVNRYGYDIEYRRTGNPHKPHDWMVSLGGEWTTANILEVGPYTRVEK